MAQVESIKMVLLTALILLGAALCEVGNDQLGAVEQSPEPAHGIENRIVTG
ncbi:hypothetical protein SAMN05444358_1011369 [Ruegeria halocynthiae]|uniref:Uncharacterized protein n=1 Tax=Ruegeria halocynthiae TaxID=985054 RepID=A0A1H2V5H9_9RHOB|nr:hypothetical protein [Ruegeria halocynthiae]SDW63596.1 hypothetical protein SAMN05444358_1011369 [Ruegeria halocynthiae]